MLVNLACMAVQALHSKIADARYTEVDRLYFSYVFRWERETENPHHVIIHLFTHFYLLSTFIILFIFMSIYFIHYYYFIVVLFTLFILHILSFPHSFYSLFLFLFCSRSFHSLFSSLQCHHSCACVPVPGGGLRGAALPQCNALWLLRRLPPVGNTWPLPQPVQHEGICYYSSWTYQHLYSFLLFVFGANKITLAP